MKTATYTHKDIEMAFLTCHASRIKSGDFCEECGWEYAFMMTPPPLTIGRYENCDCYPEKPGTLVSWDDFVAIVNSNESIAAQLELTQVLVAA